MSEYTELDILYSPSRWQKRFNIDEIIEKHVGFLDEQSKFLRKSIPATLNISYGRGEREKYDLFGTDLPQNSPILIYIHGGYWQEPVITHSLGNCLSLNLYNNKIKSIFIGYELCPQVTLIELVKNIEIALKKCLDYAIQNNASVYLAGHSAGAQLVASLFETFVPNLPENTRNLIKDCFLLGGIYDLVPLIKTVYNVPLKLNETDAKQLSPIYQDLKLENRRFFIIAAELDSPKFVEESENFYEKIVKCSSQSKYILVKNVDHFNLIEKLIDDDYELNKLILNVIKKRI